MKKFIFTILVSLFCAFAVAKPVGQIMFQNGGRITLHNESTWCQAVNPKSFDGTYTYPDGKVIKACWIMTPRGIFFADEEGDSEYFPPQMVEKLADS